MRERLPPARYWQGIRRGSYGKGFYRFRRGGKRMIGHWVPLCQPGGVPFRFGLN